MKRIIDDEFTTKKPKKPKYHKEYFPSRPQQYDVLPVGKDVEGYTKFSLMNASISHIPENMISHYWLTHLNLERNKLTTLSDSLCTLPYLQHLNLEWNYISLISPKIDQLKYLSRLEMGHNRLKTVPVEMSNLENLDLLDLQSNLLETLPSRLSRLTQLKWLILYGNDNLKVPLQLGRLQKTLIDIGPQLPYGVSLKQIWKQCLHFLTLLHVNLECDSPILEATFENFRNAEVRVHSRTS
jgi:Leucine-rich repeat (LRR) protein